MTALYNEIDPFAASWIERLSLSGLVAPGSVERRSVRDLSPADVSGATQFHAFAGIAVWSHALRLAGWPDDCPVWTGSCPCQSLSTAGRQKGFDDERHLWPTWFGLIRECRPPVVFGEQVDSPLGRAWLDLVCADLEGVGYAVGKAVLPAAGVGAPHARHRIYLVAYADGERLEGVRLQLQRGRSQQARAEAARGSEAGELADTQRERGGPRRELGAHGRAEEQSDRHGNVVGVANAHEGGRRQNVRDVPAREPDDDGCSVPLVLGDARRARGGRDARAISPTQGEGARRGRVPGRVADKPVPPIATRRVAHADLVDALDGDEPGGGAVVQPARDALAGFWYGADWLLCTDGKARPIEPGLEPLAYRSVSRVGRLRGYGNAIVAQVAAEVIGAAIDVLVGVSC